MSKTQPGYRSYLLRLWQAYTEGELVWRASLESPHSRQRRGFVSLADLFAFLESEVGDAVQGQAALDADGEGGDPREKRLGATESEIQNLKMKGKGG